MSVKYPNTYMEQFCKSLHPDLELGTICVSWFHHATKHCAELISNNRLPTTYFWTTVKNFIFPDRETELISQKIPISIHPNRLTVQDCQALFLDIVNDYVQRAPRYAAESTTNVMLWQVLYSLMGIMALGSLLLGIIFTYNKYSQFPKQCDYLKEIFKPENRMQAIAERSLRLAKAELRNIHVKPVVKSDDILPIDGCKVMVLKVSNKFELMESVVMGCLQSTGKLHRLYDQYSKTKTDFKIEALAKAMKFLDNNCKKLHLLLMFEENAEYEEEENKMVIKNFYSPIIKNLSPRKMPSPQLSTVNRKRIINTRLEGGAVAMLKATSTSRSNSPKDINPATLSQQNKQATPRTSSVTTNSGIPRNVLKRPLISKKTI